MVHHHPAHDATVQRPIAGRWGCLLLALGCAALATKAAALDVPRRHHYLPQASFLESTHLIDIQQGSALSRTVRGLGSGGFELAGGSAVGFQDWYRTRWTDLSLTWMTQVTENFGFIFGASTGERGPKYTIRPGLKLGMVVQTRVARDAVLSLRVTTVLGGRLKEKSCTADYGDIGGVQAVNCRLAASTLAPADTLQYLLNQKPGNQVSLSLTWRF
ncbi:hypothetical protein [Macromonas nakdongensis]|uniref:hypothetical protein n=1 Tax=Macromonas nakdongensis TaxID=1843082 RepID=UPI000C3452A8|nr:hypothetical protein [Macromonas nakdongensis]